MRPTPISRQGEWWIAVLLFVATIAVFGRAVPHGFVNYDDPDYVTANPHVRAGLTPASVRWAFTSTDISYWHPLTWLSHEADVQFFGDGPQAQHAVNVAWHALNAALAFLALYRLTGCRGASVFAAALFAWHPLRVESVAWIAERKDVLSGFFGLVTLWAYAGYARAARAADGRAWWWYAAAVAAGAGALMSKPMLVSMPGLLLVLDFWPLGRWPGAGAGAATWRRLGAEKIPFCALSAGVGWITVVAQRQVGTLSTVLPLSARLANAAVAVARYLGKFFVPIDLAVLYPHPGHWPAAAVAAATMLLAGLTALAWRQRRRRPWLLAGWLWFVVTLAPASGIVQVGIQSLADRYTYLPMIGIELALIWTLREWLTARAAGTLALAAAVALTWQQLGYWRDSYALFDHAIAVTQNNYLAYNNRGFAEAAMGREDEAVADYRHSLAINPSYPDANNNLGRELEQRGQATDAVPLLRTALRAKPDALEVRNNLANALSDLGQLPEAMQHYEFILARDPRHVNALNGSGVALAMQGRLPEATARLEEVLRIDPANASAHANLGNVCAMQGRRDDAIAHYRRALELNPSDKGVAAALAATQARPNAPSSSAR